ncbi:MAG: hypothetical protein R3E92_12525 [Burkholderiaceae bacterium]
MAVPLQTDLPARQHADTLDLVAGLRAHGLEPAPGAVFGGSANASGRIGQWGWGIAGWHRCCDRMYCRMVTTRGAGLAAPPPPPHPPNGRCGAACHWQHWTPHRTPGGTMPNRTLRPTLRPLALAAILSCLYLAPASAGVGTTGSVGVSNGAILGPGNTVMPTTTAWIGSPGTGSLLVDAGSFLQLARMSFGLSGTGIGTGLITGSGTRVELVGDGASNNQVQRLMVGDWGIGQLTVNQGALLTTRLNPTPCLLPFHYCDTFVGGAAGDTATLNIDGTGTQVLIGSSLFVAHPGINIGANAQVTYGVPSGTVRGTVNVTGGALLSTDRATIATDHWDTHATGHERNIGEVNVSGAGSRWVVTGGNVVNHSNGVVSEGGAYIGTANHRNALASLNVTNGGALEFIGPQGAANGGGINLTAGGGRTDMLVSGTGSRVTFGGDNTYLQVGRRLGSAVMSVLDGAKVTGLQFLSVGRDGSFGELLIDGAGSQVSLTGTVSTEARGGGATLPFVASASIGRNGTGNVTVRNGGQLSVSATVQGDGGPLIDLGRDAASSGRLTISGAGSVVSLSAQSVLPGGGPTEAFNPLMRVGRDGNELAISDGGKLLIDGQAIATVADHATPAMSAARMPRHPVARGLQASRAWGRKSA